MELKIEIDETRFKDILENELKAFTQEELHGIIHDAMKEYLLNDEILKKLFTETSPYVSYNNRGSYLLQHAVDKFDLSPVFDDVKKSVIEYIKSDNALKEMAYRMFSDMVSNGIYRNLCDNTDFRMDLTNEILGAVNNRLQG